ncbi:MAG: M23 family metallopeptidase [Alphaproteobacteria bacterium]|nr:M23 family metallopeptidase [Alphaproteobacteria bacterium]
MRNLTAAVVCVAALPAMLPAWAEEPPLPLSLPIQCTPGTDCWAINHVDLDPTKGRRDYRCLAMTYDGHKGTDIALANDGRLADDVPVLATAPGRVVGTRDGMADVNARTTGFAAVKGKECGNGVRIDHGSGWATQYCHMKRGSIRVRQGDMIERGQALGAVGLSGATEFVHVHLSVTKDGSVIDPYRGVAGGPDCGAGDVPLWDEAARVALLNQPAPVLLDAGLSGQQVTKEQAASGTQSPATIPAAAPVMILWLRAAGVEPGDTARMVITRPDGSSFFDDTITANHRRILFFRFVGRKNRTGAWPTGDWRGGVTLARDGVVTAEREVEVRVDR